jgi:hypothetical protein
VLERERVPAPRRLRLVHGVHRTLAWIVAPLWAPLAGFWLGTLRGYAVEGQAELRAEFRRIRSETPDPLMVCTNHLTMIDSFIVAWALASPWTYLWDFDALLWNTPERTNFAYNIPNRVLAFFAKCIPITRGGERGSVAKVLNRVSYLLGRGEMALLFPEGGRSRSGRVEVDSGAWGVGRIVGSLPKCRVLCVYMRGDRQETWSSTPERGDTIRLRLACIEPKSDSRGARRSRDLSQQIISQLARMEDAYFDDRK